MKIAENNGRLGENELIEHLAAYINEMWEEEISQLASFSAGADGDEQAGRELIETFLELCDDLKIVPVGGLEATACFSEMKKMLKRVLAVNLKESANRKGALPQAMGLVSRRDAVDRIRDHVIYFAYDHAKYYTGVPRRKDKQCADLVARAFEKTGKLGQEEDGGLTIDKIKKTYQRMSQKI